jgi:D-alanine-D-alanine ligase
MLIESKYWAGPALRARGLRTAVARTRNHPPKKLQRPKLKKKLKVLALFDAVSPTTIDQDLSAELATADWKTEANVLNALAELGHNAQHLAIFDDLDLLQQKLQQFEPDIIFNLADQFKNNRAFDQNIVSFLAMRGIAFTGCGSTGLTLCKHKAISKKILGYHRIHTPEFVTIARGKRIARPKNLKFPILVKPLKEEASLGISQASFVETDDQFRERVQFIHEKFDNDVIAEEYIEGRELYVSVMGNHRLDVFPIRELVFREVPPDEPKIATYKAKWDEDYRKRWGLENRDAEGIDPAVVSNIQQICRRIYHLLTIDGYARLDLRLTADNKVYFIEANPNPTLAEDEDFAQSARKAGLTYPQVIDRIIRVGLKTVRD